MFNLRENQIDFVFINRNVEFQVKFNWLKYGPKCLRFGPKCSRFRLNVRDLDRYIRD